MSSISDRSNATTRDGGSDIDAAEKGLYHKAQDLVTLPPPIYSEHIKNLRPPVSPIHEGISRSSSFPILTLPANAAAVEKKPAPPPVRKVGRWTLFQLWFNTYRKFFTFVTILNLVGIIMTSVGRFPYAKNHLGSLVLGNLLGAILMRNELFMRFLYFIAIYGLRSVRPLPFFSTILQRRGHLANNIYLISGLR
jgi:hypothetical protein